MIKKLKDLFDSSTNKWIIGQAKAQGWGIILLALVYAVMAYLGVQIAALTRGIVDSAVSADVDGIIYYAVILLTLTLIQLLSRLSSKIISFNIGAKLEISIKQNLFTKILKKNYNKITSLHTGELMNRIISDVGVITGAITSIVPSLTYFLVKLIGVFAVLFSIDAQFSLIFLVGGILLGAVVLLFKSKMKEMHKKVQETEGKTRSFFQEIFSSLLVVKVFEADKKVADNAMALQQDNFVTKRKRNYISIFATTGFSFVFSLGYIYALIWGSVSIFNGSITYGTLTSLLALVSQIQSPVRGLTSVLPQYYQALASAERLIEIENMPDEEEINENDADIAELYSRMERIVFDNISFGYGRDTVLENTCLDIEKGDFIVISGISGIGKSTLTKLLLNVVQPDGGEIYIKLTSGEKAYIDRHNRKLFAYVPQGNFLLSGTIRDNIAFVCPDADDARIMEAAKIACAENFISELPEGLDTVLGENGRGLSEGQVQRIAIARAVISDAPILIFDEATSALDAENERRLLKNLKSLENKTCILITHKIAAKSLCNKEIIIDGKKIIASQI